jgi:hypothetical protein
MNPLLLLLSLDAAAADYDKQLALARDVGARQRRLDQGAGAA